jgi:homoserine O-acetyltransferase
MHILKSVLAALLAIVALFTARAQQAQTTLPIQQGDYIAHNFKFGSGETLPELRLHYRTLGSPKRNASDHVTNAVLILHGTGGTGTQFLGPQFAGVLFEPGQLLDAAKYYIILPDGIGHGGSSKPSDDMHARFANYDYDDMVAAQHLLLTEGLHIDHLRLILGTSMGCMHSWVWGETYPGFSDALMPLACLPVQLAGRNRMMRKMAMDGIRNDPAWNNGDYTAQPLGLKTALYMLLIMVRVRFRCRSTFRRVIRQMLIWTISFAPALPLLTPTIFFISSMRRATTIRRQNSLPSQCLSWPSTRPTTSSILRS